MKQVLHVFTVLSLSVFFIGCDDEKPVQPPTLGFHGIVEQGTESAKVTVEIVNPGGVKIDNYGVLYGKSSSLTPDNSTRVSGGTTSAKHLSPTLTLSALQPDETFYFKGYLEVNGETIYGTETPIVLSFGSPLNSFSPEKGGAGQRITLENMSLYYYNSLKVFVGGVEAKIVEKPNFTIIELPAGLTEGSHDVEVDINGKRMKFTKQILYLGGKWTKKAVFPGGTGSQVSFAIGDLIFAGLGKTDSNKFWKYDTKTDQWAEVASFPGNARLWATGLAIGQKGYVMLGNINSTTTTSQVWEYDPAQNQWAQKNDFPGTHRYRNTAFAYLNKGYLGFGSKGFDAGFKDLWIYTPDTDSWQISSITFPGSDRAQVGGTFGMLSIFAGGGLTSSAGLKDWWEYSFVGQSWTKKADYPGKAFYNQVTIPFEHFVLRGGGNGNYDEFFLYNIPTGEWKEVAPFQDIAEGQSGYYINGKVYLLYTYGASYYSQQPSMFEFTYSF